VINLNAQERGFTSLPHITLTRISAALQKNRPCTLIPEPAGYDVFRAQPPQLKANRSARFKSTWLSQIPAHHQLFLSVAVLSGRLNFVKGLKRTKSESRFWKKLTFDWLVDNPSRNLFGQRPRHLPASRMIGSPKIPCREACIKSAELA
jgi:hypothetical protein